MTETATNRGWLLSNRVDAALAKKQRRSSESPETLLYYQSQLEAELDDVRRRLAEAANRTDSRNGIQGSIGRADERVSSTHL